MARLDAQGHDIEENFEDPAHPLSLVFVCAMWLTGFDAPTVSTLYLDKPQKDHTLMQTIARANRVTSWKIHGVEKRNGEVVDYYNVFRRMKKALKDYAQDQDPDTEPTVQEKTQLFRLLHEAIALGLAFCRGHGVQLDQIAAAGYIFNQVAAFEDYADRLLSKDEHRKAFAVHENTITSLYEACKPDVLGRPVVRSVAVSPYLRGIIENYNAGGVSNESYFEELLKFTRDLRAESERHVREGLTEDELEIYDLLKKEKMTQAEEQKVKLAAKSLLKRLTASQPKVLVQEWFRHTQSKLRVQKTVEDVLNAHLPEESYEPQVGGVTSVTRASHPRIYRNFARSIPRLPRAPAACQPPRFLCRHSSSPFWLVTTLGPRS